MSTPNTYLDGISMEPPKQWERCMNRAVKTIKKIHEEALEQELDVERVIACIDSREAISAGSRVNEALVRWIAARELTEMLEARVDLEQKEIRRIVIENEPAVDDCPDFDLDLHRLLIVENDDAREEELLEIAKQMIDLGPEALQGIHRGLVPADWNSIVKEDGQRAFVSDLAEFILEHPDAGRKLLQEISNDVGLAKQAEADDELPKPVRFFARLAKNFSNGAEAQA